MKKMEEKVKSFSSIFSKEVHTVQITIYQYFVNFYIFCSLSCNEIKDYGILVKKSSERSEVYDVFSN